MKDEIKRRLEALGIEANGEISVFENGEPSKLTEEDKASIAYIEDKECKVYLVTKDMIDDVLMLSYLVIGAEEDWHYEFYGPIDGLFGAQAFVKSELTHGTFDCGNITLKRTDNGIKRVKGVHCG